MQMMFDNNQLLVEESLYSTSNGYLGVRANFEEGYSNNFDTIRGTYLNGYYDTHQIKYSESAYGFPKIGETILNVIDVQTIIITIDGVRFGMDEGKILELDRGLDLEQGVAFRRVKWQSNKGHQLWLDFKRMASFVHVELFLIQVKITSINFEGQVTIESWLDGNIQHMSDSDDPRVATEHVKPIVITKKQVENNFLVLEGKTAESLKHMRVTCCHDCEGQVVEEHQKLVFKAEFKLTKDESIQFTKYNIFTDEYRSKQYADKGKKLLAEIVDKGYRQLFDEQAEFMEQFWDSCAIEISEHEELTYAIRYSQYQLLSSAGRDGLSQVSAKGLTGPGYEGHYFWDTEIYVLPFFTLTNPDEARKLLKYRYSTLESSKERSLMLGHKQGAKIPWRTISGRECSSYFPAGTAQYHINADVAYAYIQYYLMTKDKEMMREFGYEVLVETAKLWIEVGHFSNGFFNIDAVTGPDEYTAIVNNNYYTNAMAKYHLQWVVRLYDEYSDCADITFEAINTMAKAAEEMKLPFSKELNLHLQDDNFINKKRWDFENTPKDKYPLLLNFHPLTIYRHQVLKQADTILAYFLLDNVSDEILYNGYHYYEKITTHDSSLSPCVYGMMASRINAPEVALEFFMKSVYLDLENSHGNTKDGIHIANAGGSFMAIVFGFAGVRLKEDGVHIKPTKPVEWPSYSFKMKIQKALVHITISDIVSIKTSAPMELYIDDHLYQIEQTLEVEYHGKH